MKNLGDELSPVELMDIRRVWVVKGVMKDGGGGSFTNECRRVKNLGEELSPVELMEIERLLMVQAPIKRIRGTVSGNGCGMW